MKFILAFIFAGSVCGLAQIVLDNTKLTPGHVTSIFTVIGAVLSFLGIYDWLINIFGAGATVLISNFGHLLYQAGLVGYYNKGWIGIFSDLLNNSGVALVSVIVFSFVFALIFKPKN
jgi:stage V sporulation protein AE